MPLHYQNLDSETRRYMIDKIKQDIAVTNLYMGAFLSETGKSDWPKLLLNAATSGDDSALATELSNYGRLLQTAVRRKPKSEELTTYKVPVMAPEMLAEGEFNRFYARGLCRVAIEKGIPYLVVYRAKQVAKPRSESEAKIGLQVDPKQLLRDLRISTGVEPALGIPPGPNSGLSVRLP